MSNITVNIKRLDPTVELPKYAHPTDAGLDLRANEDCTLKPFERRLVSTGLAIALPDGYAGFVQPRSGLAIKQGLSIVNTPGLIDATIEASLRSSSSTWIPPTISRSTKATASPSSSSKKSPRSIS